MGHDAQAEAFATLRSALDVHIARVETAQRAREETERKAAATRDRAITEGNAKLETTLSEVATRHATALAEIEAKHATKKAQAEAHRNQVEQQARHAHKKLASRAKKERMETVWLADTVLESTLRNAQLAHKKDEGTISAQVSEIDGLESRLAQLLGPSLSATVAGYEQPPRGRTEAPSFEGLGAAIQESQSSVQVLVDGGLKKLVRGRKKKIEMGSEAIERLRGARAYAEALSMRLQMEHDGELAEIRGKHRSEVERADHTLRVVLKDSEVKTGAAVKEAHDDFERRMTELVGRRDQDRASLDQWQEAQQTAARKRHQAQMEEANGRFDEVAGTARHACEQSMRTAREELLQATTAAMSAIDNTGAQTTRSNPPFAALPEANQPGEVPRVVRLAEARLGLTDRIARLSPDIREETGIPQQIQMPAVLSLPGPNALLISHDSGGRDRALATMRTVMTRVLAQFPAGKARFVLADPVGIGQSFAGFMRLSDHEPSPVGQRIWSEPQHIERQLADVTEHMQTVIQKYLRADYATIEDYNRAAGEIAEPYRFVVIADLAQALTDPGAGRLKSILESGPRCGVYALLSADATEKLPADLQSVLDSTAVRISIAGVEAKFVDQRFDEVVITLDEEPDDALTARILDRVAQAGTQAGRVEVPFERLAPDDAQIWSRTCDEELIVPLGRSGAQRVQELRLGQGTRQHALIAGRTGSGKSTLLHVMITAAAMWHDPDELEMYLIDFKKGVEFKAYTGGRVPHVRAVAIESDREFGLSVLKRLDEELTERGELFRRLGAQNLASARSMAPEETLPRILLIIDEFQEFFTEDDEVASEATLLLDRLVRQGRAFGVHVVLGSQTLSGAYSLARSTLGQIGVRIALQCSEADSYLILGEDNNAARLLERPGEAIYNNAGGLVEGNSPFQTAWLPDTNRDKQIARMPVEGVDRPNPVVFEGNKPAEFSKSVKAFRQAYPDISTPRLLLGDAVAIAPPTSVALNRRSGANLIIVGPQSEPASGMLLSGAITFGETPGARVVFIDPTPEDDSEYGHTASVLGSVQTRADVVPMKEVDRAIADIRQLVEERGDGGGEPLLLVLGGLHRLRSLRKSEDYSFSLDEKAASSPDKDLAIILRDGPSAGVWTAAWCDTLTNLERNMDRGTVREFGLRVLMQMSASDSAMLMDSSAASNLGANRAILVDEVGGTREKFRPVKV